MPRELKLELARQGKRWPSEALLVSGGWSWGKRCSEGSGWRGNPRATFFPPFLIEFIRVRLVNKTQGHVLRGGL